MRLPCHHGVFFFPPWWKETFTTVERNIPRDGKNKSSCFFVFCVKGLSCARCRKKRGGEGGMRISAIKQIKEVEPQEIIVHVFLIIERLTLILHPHSRKGIKYKSNK